MFIKWPSEATHSNRDVVKADSFIPLGSNKKGILNKKASKVK